MDHGGAQTVGSTLDKKLFFTRLIWVRITAGWDNFEATFALHDRSDAKRYKEGPATPIGRVK